MATSEGNIESGREEAPAHVAEDTRRLLARMASDKATKSSGATKVIDLTFDSVLEVMGLGSETDPSYPRHLTFEGFGWCLDIDVIRQEMKRRLEGCLREGIEGQAITVRQSGVTTNVDLDVQSRFVVLDLSPGPVSVSWEEKDGTSVETSWVSI